MPRTEILALAGSHAGAPMIGLFGAFFPAWLLCAAFGLLACLVFRAIAMAVRVHDAIPFKLVVYTAFAMIAAMTSWLVVFSDPI